MTLEEFKQALYDKLGLELENNNQVFHLHNLAGITMDAAGITIEFDVPSLRRWFKVFIGNQFLEELSEMYASTDNILWDCVIIYIKTLAKSEFVKLLTKDWKVLESKE